MKECSVMISKNAAKSYLGHFSDTLCEEKFLDGFIKISNKCGLNNTHLSRSLTNILPSLFNLKTKGIREVLSVYLREFAILGMLENYDTKIYGGTPAQVLCFDALANASSSAYVGFPDYLLTIVLGVFFDTTNLVTGNCEIMRQGARHCLFNSMRLYSAQRKILPSPDVYWVNGTYCDEAPKTNELLKLLGYDWNTTVTRLPHDAKYGINESKDTHRIEYLASQYEHAYEDIFKATHIRATTKNFAYAMRECGRICYKIDILNKKVAIGNPQPISANELCLFSLILSMRLSQGYTEFEKSLDSIIQTVNQRIAAGEGIAEKDTPKLGCTFIPLTVPQIDIQVREYGFVLSFIAPLSLHSDTFKKPSYVKPLNIIAEQWLRQPYSVNLGRYAEMMSQQLNTYKIKTLLYGVFYYDRWLGAFEKQAIPELESRCGVKCIRVERDFFQKQM